jgi:hypothetical protein
MITKQQIEILFDLFTTLAKMSLMFKLHIDDIWIVCLWNPKFNIYCYRHPWLVDYHSWNTIDDFKFLIKRLEKDGYEFDIDKIIVNAQLKILEYI